MGARPIPTRAQVAIVREVIIGTSTAYHLTRRGWTDVTPLERSTLASGTAWHAAGLVTQAGATSRTRQVVQGSLEVFALLEADTGFSPGFVRTGTMNLATTPRDLKSYVTKAVRYVRTGPLLNC